MMLMRLSCDQVVKRWEHLPFTFFHGPVFFVGKLGGGFKHVLFAPLFGEDFQFD